MITVVGRAGFVTMTFDCCHPGHFELLRFCRQRCDYLIVGLTTDERALHEKRQTILTYEQRYAILKNCQFVDEVVANNGEPKAEMLDKLHFNILFSGDDYYQSNEFETFKAECPHIPVVFLPRNPNQSSTHFINRLMDRYYKSQQILAPSIYGQIVLQGYGKPHHVTKCLPFSKLEMRSTFASNDVFGFYKYFDTLPRNWKSPNHTHAQPFPMISGIHSNRELLINEKLQSQSWCTYISHSVVYLREETPNEQEEHKQQQQQQQPETLLEFANFVCKERSIPRKIVQIVQRYAGKTFDEWCKTTCKSKADFDRVVHYVRDVIIPYLEECEIVHSDIHPRNVLIDPQTRHISLIDFGWVTASTFELCEKERLALNRMLNQRFDWNHFQKSLLLCPNTKKWLQQEESDLESQLVIPMRHT